MILEHVVIAVIVGDMISRELDEDGVEIWAIVWHLRHMLPEASDSEVRELAEAIMRGLVARGVAFGELAEDSGLFTPWKDAGGVDEVMRRWRALGRDPNIGEIAWLVRR